MDYSQMDRGALIAEIERLGVKSDAEMERVKACEHIAVGDGEWEILRNLCPSTAAVARLRDQYTLAMSVGGMNEFPRGKLNDDDEGALRLAVSSDSDGIVKIVFGKPVSWLGLPPAEARQLAALIQQHAERIE